MRLDALRPGSFPRRAAAVGERFDGARMRNVAAHQGRAATTCCSKMIA